MQLNVIVISLIGPNEKIVISCLDQIEGYIQYTINWVN
jgi:hypothetical protein